ncbi:MAG: hypothetical protein MI748_11795 [Opitutales bacterium]|nr:hypothetical protein [Opitutales bacterium]
MKKLLFTLVASIAATCAAQNPYYVSPIIHEDHTVTFTLYAPEAKEVYVDIVNSGTESTGKVLMEKNEDGFWTKTLGPFDPEIYYYLFHTDGSKHCDVRNPNIKKWLFSVSVFEIPGEAVKAYSQQEIPHGVVQLHHYQSRFSGKLRKMWVYLPPNYSEETKYPVAFFHHGWGAQPNEWIENGRIHFIADHLINEGKMKPMIIVMPEGHPAGREILNTQPNLKDFKVYRANNNPHLASELKESIIPFLEEEFSLAKGPENRALIGASMGGEQAIEIGLTHSDTFAFIIAMSASYYRQYEKMPELNEKKSETFANNKLFRICFGDQEMEMGKGELTGFRQWLTDNEIPFQWSISKGGHEWDTWRRELLISLPLLFQW